MSDDTATPTTSAAPATPPPAAAEPDPFRWAEDADSPPPEAPSADDAPGGEDDASAEPEEPAEGEEPDGEEKPEPAATHGTESDPLAPDEVPEQWVRVRMDGQDVVLSLKEAVQGGIRTATFQRRMEKLAETTKAVEARAAELEKADESVRTFIDRLNGDADYAQAWLSRFAPNALAKVVDAEIQRRIEDSKLKPEERTARELAQERARLEHERETWRQEQTRIAQERATEEARQQLQPLLQGAAESHGLAFDRHYLALMRTALEPVFDAGRAPSKAEIEQAAKEIAQWRGVQPKPAPPPPKPPAPAPRPAASSSGNGKRSSKAPVVDSRQYFAELRRSLGTR